MNSLDAEEVIGYVNKIIDNIRCSTCDKLGGSRVRYTCGHTSCDECVIYTQGCQTCTSPSISSNYQSKPDKTLTGTVKNAVNLLTECQNLFNVNVFQRKRISEQLRIEKELFPKCIQAPLKYENKRKSTIYQLNNKENTYSEVYPGEVVTSSTKDKMENTTTYVQQWLNKNEKVLARKAFADLNVNTQWTNSPKSTYKLQNLKDENVHLDVNRKRSHYKTTAKDYSSTHGFGKPVYECVYNTSKKVKKDSTSYNYTSNIIQKKCDKNESGIFMDNDPIVIDDSQDAIIDKDKNAWLAVLESCKNEDLESTSFINSNIVNYTNDSNKNLINCNSIGIKQATVTKVPFIKKSAIIETCKYCNNEAKLFEASPVTNRFNTTTAASPQPIKIIVDGDSFITTITVSKSVQNNVKINTKNTVSVQTDTCETITNNHDDSVNYCNSQDSPEVKIKQDNATETLSEDLFADDRKIFEDIDQRTEFGKCIVIEESDSDTSLDVSGPMSVKVDVHRSCEDLEYGILTNIVNVRQHDMKPRRRPRGHTPTSTDSSEKENYNPNRMKRLITGKKKKYEKE